MTLRTCLYLSLCVALFTASDRSAAAAARPGLQTSLAAIEGSAHFALHYTIVPLATAEPHPEPYWGLVVNSNGVDYEIDQKFDVGHSDAPEQVQLNGVTIPDGATVSLEGRAAYVSSQYVYLTSVQDVSLVRSAYKALLRSRTADDVSDWSCTGVLDHRMEIDLEVDQASIEMTGVDLTQGLRRSVGITSLDHIQVATDANQTIYSGFGTDASVKLVITDAAPPSRVKASLEFSVSQESELTSLQGYHSLQVDCVPRD